MASAALAFLWSALEYVAGRPQSFPFWPLCRGGFAFWSVAYRFHKVSLGPNYGTAALFLQVSCIFYLQATENIALRIG